MYKAWVPNAGDALNRKAVPRLEEDALYIHYVLTQRALCHANYARQERASG